MNTSTEIACRELRHGERVFYPGDKINLEFYINNRTMTERLVSALREQKAVVPLTRENYARAVARRALGTIGKGFTTEELIALGIIDPPQEPTTKADALAAAARSPHRATEPAPERVPPAGETVIYEGRHITPRPRGTGHLPPLWWATDPDGAPLRATGFKTLEGAKAFIDNLIATDLANRPAPDTSEAQGGESAPELETHGSDV